MSNTLDFLAYIPILQSYLLSSRQKPLFKFKLMPLQEFESILTMEILSNNHEICLYGSFSDIYGPKGCNRNRTTKNENTIYVVSDSINGFYNICIMPGLIRNPVTLTYIFVIYYMNAFSKFTL